MNFNSRLFIYARKRKQTSRHGNKIAQMPQKLPEPLNSRAVHHHHTFSIVFAYVAWCCGAVSGTEWGKSNKELLETAGSILFWLLPVTFPLAFAI